MRVSLKRTEGGQANLEFALCAIFVIFLIISIFDMARGLWINHTVTEVVRDGNRWAAVHGASFVNPITTPPTRLAGGTVGDLVKFMEQLAVGIVPSKMNVTLRSGSPAVPTVTTCNPITTCEGSTSVFPPSGNDAVGDWISVSASYSYTSMVMIFFPGSRPVGFGTYLLGSTAEESVIF